MASTPVTQYTIIKPSSTGLNDLFTRIEALRKSHLTASQNAGTNTSGITTAFATNVAVTGNPAARANVQQLKTDIDAVAASGSFVANKGSTPTTITVPAVGDLITATNFNTWNNIITGMEGVCAHYGRYSGHYSGRYDSHYSGFYSNFYSSDYSSHYSSFYSNFYSSRYGSRYSSFFGFYSYVYSRYSRSSITHK